MRIEIENQIDAEAKEVWSFNVFDLNIVFIAWHIETKPKGKRKWTIEKFWDKYNHRRHIGMAQEPELPEIIRKKVLHEVVTNRIKVLTWGEWKDKK